MSEKIVTQKARTFVVKCNLCLFLKQPRFFQLSVVTPKKSSEKSVDSKSAISISRSIAEKDSLSIWTDDELGNNFKVRLGYFRLGEARLC
jgi:hypothetical protein